MASRKKQSRPTRKRDGIHFINARPANDTEREDARRLVRAHVGRWISDQTKDRSNVPDASAHPARATARAIRDSISPLAGPNIRGRAGSAYTLLSRRSPPFPVATALGPAGSVAFEDQPRREWPPSPFAPSQTSDSSDSSDDTVVTIYSNEAAATVPWRDVPPIEPQITGVFDPFCTYPSRFAPDVVNACESYCSSSQHRRRKIRRY